MKQGMTTKNAGNLLSSVVTHTRRVSYDVSIARRFMQSQLTSAPPAALETSASSPSSSILSAAALPSLTAVYMLDAVVAKVQVSLDDLFVKAVGESDPQHAMMVAQDLLPSTLRLIELYTVYMRYVHVRARDGFGNGCHCTSTCCT